MLTPFTFCYNFFKLKEDVAAYGTALAVLTVIGGLDDRPRIGGLVQHDELGIGTITRTPNKNKVVVLFHGRSAKLCPLNTLKTVGNKNLTKVVM